VSQKQGRIKCRYFADDCLFVICDQIVKNGSKLIGDLLGRLIHGNLEIELGEC